MNPTLFSTAPLSKGNGESATDGGKAVEGEGEDAADGGGDGGEKAAEGEGAGDADGGGVAGDGLGLP